MCDVYGVGDARGRKMAVLCELYGCTGLRARRREGIRRARAGRRVDGDQVKE